MALKRATGTLGMVLLTATVLGFSLSGAAAQSSTGDEAPATTGPSENAGEQSQATQPDATAPDGPQGEDESDTAAPAGEPSSPAADRGPRVEDIGESASGSSGTAEPDADAEGGSASGSDAEGTSGDGQAEPSAQGDGSASQRNARAGEGGQPSSGGPAESPEAGSQGSPVTPVQQAGGEAGDGASGGAPGAAASAPDMTVPHDLSPMGMFMAADWIVKAVMLGLAFASLVTWTILIAKGMELALAKRRASSGVRRLSRAESLDDALAGKRKWRGPVAGLARIATSERSRSSDLAAGGVKERVSMALSRAEARAGRSISRGTGILATIGSTAPFVGLFGTVWGIMNAFIGISEAETTNLAVVAPGIAEALLATAIGLVAAIPAVVIYNLFARSIAGYRATLADGSAVVLQHLSRDLDRSSRREASPRGGMAAAAE